LMRPALLGMATRWVTAGEGNGKGIGG
jgi:hypothetical protein